MYDIKRLDGGYWQVFSKLTGEHAMFCDTKDEAVKIADRMNWAHSTALNMLQKALGTVH